MANHPPYDAACSCPLCVPVKWQRNAQVYQQSERGLIQEFIDDPTRHNNTLDPTRLTVTVSKPVLLTEHESHQDEQATERQD